jgi:hypothetical protein
LAQGASILKDELKEVRASHHGGNFNYDTNLGQEAIQEFKEYNLESKSILMDLKERLHKLESAADGETIRFFGLGFKDRRDSETWAQEHLQNCVFGTIVDVHLVM